jgi:DNA-binding MarR family transcriptional regulator
MRSVFEADMIFSIVAHHALKGRPITLKELATYFGMIATEATVSRHIDDMEQGGLVERRLDEGDRRRMFLMPTRRLEGLGHEFQQARLRIMRENGFVWNGGNSAG